MSDAILLKDISLRYESDWAVDGLNLNVPEGSAFGLLGENGAGKSTTMQMVMGMLKPLTGSVSILGLDPIHDDVEIKSRVGYVSEKHGFYPKMTVDETIALVAAYHRTWNSALSIELKGEFNLPGTSKVGELSKGMQAKLALLLALAFEPEILVLDEPAGGLDAAARRHIIETILARFQESGRTIFLSSHLLNEFSGLLDEVAFIADGRVELQASADDLYRQTKRLRFVFEDGTPANLQIPGAIHTRVNGREAIAVVDQFDESTTLKSFASINANQIMVENMTLEDIFVARVSA